MSLTGVDAASLMGGVTGDWVSTAHGRLYHLARGKQYLDRFGREMTVTRCGRVAFDSADHPIATYNGRACEPCVRGSLGKD